MTIILTDFERTFNISTNFVTMKSTDSTGTSTGTTATGSTSGSTTGSTTGTTSTTLTNELSISGIGEIGKKLSADTTQLFDTNGMGKFTYQWQSQGVDIVGATSKTYTVKTSDYGKYIKLKVSYVDINFKTIVKESNMIIIINGSYINDIVEFKLAWQTLYVPKTITPSNKTTLEKLDGVLLFYDANGICNNKITVANSSYNTTKTSETYKIALPEYATVTKDLNVTSNIITYQVDFSKLDVKYTKVVYCVYELATPPNVSMAPIDLYPKESWAASADLSKKLSVTGTVSPFKTVFNNRGLFILDINTLGTVKYPKTILKFGEESRLRTATVDSKERLCVFGVFTRSPDNNGWFFETKYKLKSQLKGVAPLDYLKPLSKFTDLGL